MVLVNMRAIAFDLGETLVEYQGMPLSWEAHYPEALLSLGSFLQITPTAHELEQACAVLRCYNTRIHPRTAEVSFSKIVQEMPPCFHAKPHSDELACATAFFQIFRQKLRCFPDVSITLDRLRGRKIKIGIFTDVPYGMPRELVLADLKEASLEHSYNALLTSRDAGFRKPSPVTLRLLAAELSCTPSEMVYVGNEQKDIEAARAFGCSSILIDRKRINPAWGQDRTIMSLSELLPIVREI